MTQPPRQSPAAMKRVEETVRRLSIDQLDVRCELPPEDPLAGLAEALNSMAERLQRRREEVVRAVELYCLRRFGIVLVHDLKNLAARLSFVPDNLRRGTDDPQVIEACAATVEDTVVRLQAMVRRFRDQRDAAVLKTQGDINHALKGAIDNAGLESAPLVKVKLDLQRLPDSLIDPPYLEEAFINILRNAVESMPEGGTLEIRCATVEDDRGRPEAEICVTDQGQGMTPEFIERDLFAPFRSTKRTGMGLGMFSCRETIELHGGRIDVDSTPGVGTRFRVVLPIQAEVKA